MKKEAALKAAFFAALKRQCPHYLTISPRDAGAPDRLIVGDGFASFFEFKHGTPRFASKDNQKLACMRLDRQLFCRYVLWLENAAGTNKRTLVVHPRELFESQKANREPTPELQCDGFNHHWLIEEIVNFHQAYASPYKCLT